MTRSTSEAVQNSQPDEFSIEENVSRYTNGNTNGNAPKMPEETARLLPLAHILDDFGEAVEAANRARISGQPCGPVSGFEALNRELCGAFAPGVHAIHGNAGAGKTAFCLQLASSCQCPALFVTCEMSPVELLRRHIARVTKTYLGRLKSGEMRREDALKLAHQAVEAAPQMAFVDATRAPAPPFPDPNNPRRFSLLEAARITRGDAPHLLIVIDSLHSWAGAWRLQGASEYDTLNMAIEALQRLAAELECPILFVSERNRSSMEAGGLNAGAGTRRIEYAAETMIDLHRADAKDSKEDSDGKVCVTLRLEKNRHGAAGKKIALKFHGATQCFSET